MRKKLLNNFRFYCILDYDTLGKTAVIPVARKLILGGVDIIQLRFKSMCLSKARVKFTKVVEDALKISRLTKKHNAIFLINDHIDIALAVDADGVHLGQDDLPISFARAILGKNRIIGISCHTIKQAVLAQGQGANYVSLGPIFKTAIKPKYKPLGLSLIRIAKRKLRLPFVAIGGINLNNFDDVLRAGARRIAVVRAICCAKDIGKTISAFKSRLNKN